MKGSFCRPCARWLDGLLHEGLIEAGREHNSQDAKRSFGTLRPAQVNRISTSLLPRSLSSLVTGFADGFTLWALAE
jgi:hypothetical protein